MSQLSDLRPPAGLTPANPTLHWRSLSAGLSEPNQLGYPRRTDGSSADWTFALTTPPEFDFANLLAVAAVFTLRASANPVAQLAVYAEGWRILEITPQGAQSPAALSEACQRLLSETGPTHSQPTTAVVLSATPISGPLPAHVDLAIRFDRSASAVTLSGSGAFSDLATSAIRQQFETALASFQARPNQRIDEIRFSSDFEREAIDAFANGPALSVTFIALPDAVARQAEATPDRIALLGPGQSITFADMQARIDARAAAISSLGVGRGARIGVCLSRCPDLIITLLAVSRCGAAYLPLDPAHPTARIEDMLADAEATFVIMDAETQARHRLTGAPVRSLSEIDLLTANAWRPPALTPDDLAYVIYTSGSTGKPKGVAVAHATLPVFFAGMDEPLRPHPDDRWLTVTAPTFDPSVLDYFWTLTHGCSVAVYRPIEAARGETGMTVAEAVCAFAATHLQCTPSVLAMMLVDPHGPAAFARLKMILVGGEALSRANADAIQALMPTEGRLINLYGPTEATVWSTTGDVPRDGGLITLGRPIANIGAHVLSPDGAVQAALAPGEIWIEGPNIALGYWRRPELTAPAFVDNARPFARRMYRTGDIARRWPDGRLEYLGRGDDQVKIRGHRIELGEIERVLERVDGVQRLVVVARPPQEGADKALYAYFTERPGASVDLGAMRAAAIQRLPDYMRPQSLIRLDAFELGPTGKIDRKKLPLPPPTLSDDGAASDDPITQQLNAIWRDVLSLSAVDSRQSFFDVGGNSVAGARLLARIDDAFGVRLPLACLFEAPTIAAQSALLTQRGAGTSFSPLVRIAPGAQGRAAFFCVHGAGGNVVFLQPLAAVLGAHRPLIGIQAFGVDGQTEALSDIHEIAARYVQAMRQAQPNGPYLLGGYSGGGAIAIEMAHQLRALGATVGLVALFDALAPGSRVTGFSLAERLAHLPQVNPAIIGRFLLRLINPFAKKPTPTTLLERAAERTLSAMLVGLDNYRPAPFDGDVLLVKAAQARLSYVVAGNLLGWEKTLHGAVDAITVNATHDDMFEGVALAELAARLRARLDHLDPPH